MHHLLTRAVIILNYHITIKPCSRKEAIVHLNIWWSCNQNHDRLNIRAYVIITAYLNVHCEICSNLGRSVQQDSSCAPPLSCAQTEPQWDGRAVLWAWVTQGCPAEKLWVRSLWLTTGTAAAALRWIALPLRVAPPTHTCTQTARKGEKNAENKTDECINRCFQFCMTIFVSRQNHLILKAKDDNKQNKATKY